MEDEQHRLIVIPDRIDEVVPEAGRAPFTFQLGTRDNVLIRGFVVPDDPRITIEQDSFEGNSISVLCNIDTTGLTAGDPVSGSVTFITSIGEKTVPVRLQIAGTKEQTYLPKIEAFEEFLPLAQRDENEAFRLFHSPAFFRLLRNEDREIQTYYRAFSTNPVTMQRLEEFLVATGQKPPVDYETDSKGASYYDLKEPVKDVIRIRKSGWGLTQLRVEAEGGFLTVMRKTITEQDFVGSVCDLTYVVQSEGLSPGRHHGGIRLSYGRSEWFVPILASTGPQYSSDLKRVEKRNRIRLTRYAEDYLTGRLSRSEYCEKTRTLLTAIRNLGDYKTSYRLYEAFVLEHDGRKSEAAEILRSFEKHNFTDDPLEYKSTFLYLCGQCGLLPPDKINIREKIRDYHLKKQESVILLGLRFLVDDDLQRSSAKRLSMLTDLHAAGCNHPLLFAYGVRLFQTEPSLLARLNPYIRQVLIYADRHGVLSTEMAKRAALLSENEREFKKSLLRVLEHAYEEENDDLYLSAICRYRMAGMPSDRDNFYWYSLGVEHDIHLTRLYEYYIEAMPENYQKELPQPIRKYFAMSDTLSENKRALIYANIIRNRSKDEETFLLYRDRMEEFAEAMLAEGRINENYTTLYACFFDAERDADTLAPLFKVAFTQRLYCDDPHVREVVVCHGELAYEEVYPIRNGSAYVRRYTKDAKILFQDGQYRRYGVGIPYSLEPLMEVSPYVKKWKRAGVTDAGFLLYLCRGEGSDLPVDFGSVDSYLKIAASPDFTEEYKQQIRKNILEFAALHTGNDAIDPILRRISYVDYAKVNRPLLIELLIARKMYEEAYDLINRYGTSGIDATLLARLTAERIEKAGGAPDQRLVLLSTSAFSTGTYDEATLKYLIDYDKGPLSRLLSIRKCAKDFYLDTYKLDERILLQAMFEQVVFPDEGEILSDYRSQGGKIEVVEAGLISISHAAFLGRLEMTPEVAALIVKNSTEKDAIPRISELALLRYYAERDILDETEYALCDLMLSDCLRDGLRFAFYTDLPPDLKAKYRLEDRVIVEQEADPGDTVILYYYLSSEGRLSDYHSVPLKQMYRRIHSREFLLFAGEVLTYYVEIEHNGVRERLPERTVTLPAVSMNGRSRYHLINQMRSAYRLEKTDEFREKLLEYRRQDAVVHALFTLEKTAGGEGV